jgi:UDP-N-acetylmuramoyl-tripeptide--D-alanyl-D-alanine ligase
MTAALETLALLDHPGRKIAVVGDMRELGDHTDRYHHELGQAAATCEPDLLICVGEKARLIGEEAARNGLDADRISYFTDANAAAAELPDWFGPGDLVLLKASRSMRLETIAHAMAEVPALRKAAS